MSHKNAMRLLFIWLAVLISIAALILSSGCRTVKRDKSSYRLAKDSSAASTKDSDYIRKETFMMVSSDSSRFTREVEVEFEKDTAQDPALATEDYFPPLTIDKEGNIRITTKPKSIKIKESHNIRKHESSGGSLVDSGTVTETSKVNFTHSENAKETHVYKKSFGFWGTLTVIVLLASAAYLFILYARKRKARAKNSPDL